jgi:hypothetical protein
VTLRDGIINHSVIIGTVPDHRADRPFYLIEQIRDHRDITNIIHVHSTAAISWVSARWRRGASATAALT